MKPDFTKSKAFSERAEKLIPGGSHTYSRGRDRFPMESPNGITHGKGSRVWDIDGNQFIDWSMGLTAVSLGHADPDVNAAVHEVIDQGVLFQRTSVVELDAADCFLNAVGTDMVKFARHGSSVTTAAVKLARAYTGRDLVAVPKEHPFFSFDDWFIGTTQSDFGVPEETKTYTKHFSYNDIDSVYELFQKYPDQIACIMLEPVKFDPPEDNFLAKLKNLCVQNGALLIFDEMVSGFKYAIPGASWMFDVQADLYTFGKGIANGYAAAALAGSGDVMRLGGIEREGDRKLFLLSTTHGGESVGLVAMMATMRRLSDGSVIKENWRRGEALKARLQRVIKTYGLQDHLSIVGYPCLMALIVKGPNGESQSQFSTLFMQEMIANNVLFQGLFFMTPSHGEKECAETEAAFEKAASVFRAALDDGKTDGYLIGAAMKPVFRKFV